MIAQWKEIWQFRELLWTLILRELRVRYKNSALGFFWSLLNPLVTVMVMTVVFKYVMGMQIPNYSAYILVAYLPWTFFQYAILDSSQTIIGYMPVIKKIYFPRELLPLGATLANLVHFGLAMGVLFAYLYLIVGVPLQWSLLWLPVVIVSQFLLTLGLSMFISCLNAFYEDVKYLVSVGMQLLFFLSPVIYFSEQIRHTSMIPEAQRESLFWAYHLLNPVATLLMAYRKTILPPIHVEQQNPAMSAGRVVFPDMPLPLWLLFVNFGFSLLIAWLGMRYFDRKKWGFVERP